MPRVGSDTTLQFIRTTRARNIAEIGVGTGKTSIELARWLNNAGHLHLFDFSEIVLTVARRLKIEGYRNVIAHGNSHVHLDSYNWSLMKWMRRTRRPSFDYIYIDGAHTWCHDALAFFLCDKMLRVGGFLDFDDYDWTIQNSPTVNPRLKPEVLTLYTKGQIRTKQVKLVIDLLVKADRRYRAIIRNRIYQKIAN